MYMHRHVYINMYICMCTYDISLWYDITQLFIKSLGSLECQSWTHHSRHFLEKGNSRRQDEYPQRWARLSSEICELDLMKGKVFRGGENVHSVQQFSNSHPWEADSWYRGTIHSRLNWGRYLFVCLFIKLGLLMLNLFFPLFLVELLRSFNVVINTQSLRVA